jgi:hypothetical protein
MVRKIKTATITTPAAGSAKNRTSSNPKLKIRYTTAAMSRRLIIPVISRNSIFRIKDLDWVLGVFIAFV